MSSSFCVPNVLEGRESCKELGDGAGKVCLSCASLLGVGGRILLLLTSYVDVVFPAVASAPFPLIHKSCYRVLDPRASPFVQSSWLL